MHFDGANPELCDAVHFGAGVGNGPRKNTAKGDEPIGRGFAIIRTPIVDLGSESYNLWRDVVDEAGAFDAESVEQAEECFGIGGVALHIRIVFAAAFDQFERGWLNHVVRHDVDMDIYDGLQGASVAFWAGALALFAVCGLCAQIINVRERLPQVVAS